MIKTFKQAIEVQERRVLADKPGIAKAVRRFLLRTHSHDYEKFRNALPVADGWEFNTKR